MRLPSRPAKCHASGLQSLLVVLKDRESGRDRLRLHKALPQLCPPKKYNVTVVFSPTAPSRSLDFLSTYCPVESERTRPVSRVDCQATI